MNIYFTASISQKAQFGVFYERIVTCLNKLDGYNVSSIDVSSSTLDKIKQETPEEKKQFYSQALTKIMKTDLVVVEASIPSTLNIGHEISLALERGKPTIVMYKQGFPSLFLDGLDSDKLLLTEYTEENLEKVLTEALDFAKDQSDTRFNFFISPRHQSYLDWISRHRRVPRSVYLRELIKRDIAKNQEFNSDSTTT